MYFAAYFSARSTEAFITMRKNIFSSIYSKGMVLESTRKMEARREATHAKTLCGSCERGWRKRQFKQQQQRKRKCRQQWQCECRQHELCQPSSANNTKNTFKLGIQLNVRIDSATYCNYG
jgi:hypothetical protein